jgi:SAM-dependent methyltransferase
VLHGTLPHDDLQPESFDVITMWHSLEHVPDPKRVLTEARRLLAPKGKLIIAVPNIDSLAFRIFGQSWFGLDLPRHLTHFAPWTLHLLLERVGYRVEPIKMVRHSSWLRHSARLACRRPEAFILHKLLKGKPFSRLAAFYSCLSGQSDCMMAVATPAADASALADAA